MAVEGYRYVYVYVVYRSVFVLLALLFAVQLVSLCGEWLRFVLLRLPAVKPKARMSSQIQSKHVDHTLRNINLNMSPPFMCDHPRLRLSIR